MHPAWSLLKSEAIADIIRENVLPLEFLPALVEYARVCGVVLGDGVLSTDVE